MAVAGRAFRALQLYRAVQKDFDGLHDLGEVSDAVDSLSALPDVTETERRLEVLAQRHKRYRDRLGDFVRTVELSDRPPTASQSQSRLQIERLQQRSENSTDTLDMLAAMRLLEMVFVHTGFYEPRRYFERSDFQRALVMLEVAHAVRPADPSVCYGLARAYAGLGRKAKALGALECMVAGTSVDAGRLEHDPNLVALQKDPAFREFIVKLRQAERQ